MAAETAVLIGIWRMPKAKSVDGTQVVRYGGGRFDSTSEETFAVNRDSLKLIEGQSMSGSSDVRSCVVGSEMQAYTLVSGR